MRGVRTARRACFGAASVFGAFAVIGAGVPAHAGATPAASAAVDLSVRPANFAGTADAAAVFHTADRRLGIAPTAQTIYGRFPDGLSQYGEGIGYARASVYYPGLAIVGLSTLLCTAGLPPACGAPQYPLYTVADGQHPDSSVATPNLDAAGAPVGIAAATADAHVDSVKGVATNAVINGYDFPGGAGAIVHAASIEAHTIQSFDSKGVLTVQAVSRLSGVDIAGGIVHIDGIAATSTTRTDGRKVLSRTNDLAITGVTAQGQKAEIGSQGVTITGSGQGQPVLDALNAALKSTLAQAGVAIHVVGEAPPPSLLDPACSKGEVDGVQIDTELDLSKTPATYPIIGPLPAGIGGYFDLYYSKVVLGSACTNGFASPDRATAIGGVVGPVGPGGPDLGTGGANPSSLGSPGGGSTSGVASGGPNGTSFATTANGGAPSTGGSLGATQQPASGGVGGGLPGRIGLAEAGLAGKGVTDRLTWLYLAFTLLFLGLCLGLRPFTPARLPSGR